MFRKFDPIRRMIVARDTGLLNEYFSVTKSQKIDLYHFATCGAMENDIPETYPEEEFTKQPWEEEVHLDGSMKLRYNMDPSEFNVVKEYDELGAILEAPSTKKR